MHLWGPKYHRQAPSYLSALICILLGFTPLPFQFHPNGPRCSHAHQEVPRGDFFELEGGPVAWMGTILLCSHWLLGQQQGGFWNQDHIISLVASDRNPIQPLQTGQRLGTALGSEGRSLGTRASGTATVRLMPPGFYPSLISTLLCFFYLLASFSLTPDRPSPCDGAMAPVERESQGRTPTGPITAGRWME